MTVLGRLVSKLRNQIKKFFAEVCRARGALAILASLTCGFSAKAAGCFPLPNGALAWWPGDGNAATIVGTNNGTLLGGATATAPGFYGSAFTFDGTNSYVQIPDSPVLRPTNLTIEAWVRFDSLDSAGSGGSPAGDQYIVFRQNSRTGDFEGFDLQKTRITGKDVFAFIVTSAADQVVQVQAVTALSTGVWYHVAAVRGTNFVQLYVNGALERQTNVSFAQDYGNNPLYFGTSGQSFWDHKLRGALDEVSFYDRALSSNDIAAIYSAGNAGKCKAPGFTVPPQAQTVITGSNALFTATATGLAPLSYQWRFQGANILNATGTSLNLANVQPAQAGNYVVVVTNTLGALTSSPALLTVLVPPAITAQPQSRTNVTGTSATFNVSASGTQPYSYQWQFNGSNLNGATGSSLTVANVQATDAGNYTVTVTNSAGSVNSAVALLTVWVPPAITAQPQNRTNITGTSATFNVSAFGTQPFAYQWQFNGSNLGGATASALTLNNVQPTDAGNYTVTVTNSAGSVNSAAAVLTVWVPPSITAQPQSRTNVTGTSATFNVSASGTQPFSYQWQFNGSNLSGATGSSLTVPNVQSVNAGNYTVSVTNSAGSVTSAVAVLTVWVPPTISAQPQNRTNVTGTSATFNVSASGTQPFAYQWQFNGSNLGGATASALTLNNVQPTDAGNYRVVVTNSAGSITSSQALLVVLGPPVFTAQPQSRTNLSTTSATFSVSVSGTPPLSYQWQLNGINLNSATDSALTLNNLQTSDAGSYRVVVTNVAGSGTSAPAALTVWVLPTVTVQPSSGICLPGTGTNITVLASGTAPLSYQWRLNGANIAGATSSVCSIPSVQPGNVGDYTVLVTNIAGSTSSSAAALAAFVTIPDSNLESVVRTTITKLTGQLSSLDLLPLTNLVSAYQNVTNLAGLEWAANLNTAYLSGNSIGDLTPLQGSKSLTQLFVDGNQISSLSPLSGLANLMMLNAGNNTIISPTPLSGLTNLTGLWLYKNPINNLTFLTALTHLNSLGINETLISDVSVLAPLSTLTSLAVGGNAVTDYTGLGGLTNLTTLSIQNGSISNLSFLANLRALNSLDLRNNQVQDLSPLVGLTSLNDLTLSSNPATNFAVLAGLTNLETLALEGNSISNVSFVAALKNLGYLYLSRNAIVDLSPLAGLNVLEGLNLARNRFTDLTGIRDLPSVEWIDLRLNPLNLAGPAGSIITNLRNRGVDVYAEPVNQPPTLSVASVLPVALNSGASLNFSILDDATPVNQLVVSALSSNPALIPNPSISITGTNYTRTLSVIPTANQTGTATIQMTVADETGLQSTGSVSVTVLVPQTVTVPDPNLEAPIRSALGKPTGSLNSVFFLSLTCLDACSAGITNLSGLQKAVSLTCLSLCNNGITDLSPLAGLTNLTSLNLGGNAITNVAALQNLRRLTNLWLYNNPIDDYGPLAGLTNLNYFESRWVAATNRDGIVGGMSNLTSLYLGGNGISSVAWLPALSRLNFLNLDDNRITDLSPLGALTDLRSLDAGYNMLTNAGQAGNLTNLTSLYLSGSAISNLTALQPLSGLTTLILNSNLITDPAILASRPYLTDLALGRNPIANFGTLMNSLSNLNTLRLEGNGISNLTFLAGLPHLKALGLGNNRLTEMSAMTTFTNLIAVDADCNRLTSLGVLTTLPSLWYVGVRTNLLNLTQGAGPLEEISSLTNRGVIVLYKPQNQPPTISLATNWFIASNTNSAALPFMVADDVTAPDKIIVTGNSLNPAIIPNAGILLGGTNANRSLILTPAPGQSGNAVITLTVTDDTGLSTNASIIVAVLDTQVVSIPDPALQAAVRSSLGKPTGPLTSVDMLALTYLDVSLAYVTNLSGLEWATNLAALSLNASGLPNLSGLQSLRRLDTLAIYNNPVPDLTPISGLTNLTSLFLQGPVISNLTAVLSLNRLTSLTLNNTRVATLAPLATLTNLSFLYLNLNWLTNITSITNLPQLLVVDVTQNKLDLSGNTAAFKAIQTLQARNVLVYYSPQRTPPVISAASTWEINANWPSLLFFTVTDDGPFSALLTAGASAANPVLLPNANLIVTPNAKPYWTLSVTPAVGQTGTTTITLVATNDAGLTASWPILVTVSAMPLVGGSLNNWTNFTWGTSPGAPWFVQTSFTHNGTPAAQSGPVADNHESWLETTMNGPGRLTFWRKVSSEFTFDWLELYINGLPQDNPISGEVDWQMQVVSIPPGNQTVRWSYAKDQNTSGGQDAAWLSEVAFAQGTWLELLGPPIDGQSPLLLHGVAGNTYQIQISTNLISWNVLTTITLSSNTSFYLDTSAGSSSRFYRLHQL